MTSADTEHKKEVPGPSVGSGRRRRQLLTIELTSGRSEGPSQQPSSSPSSSPHTGDSVNTAATAKVLVCPSASGHLSCHLHLYFPLLHTHTHTSLLLDAHLTFIVCGDGGDGGSATAAEAAHQTASVVVAPVQITRLSVRMSLSGSAVTGFGFGQ